MLSRMVPSSPPVMRTLHLLKPSDILFANDTAYSEVTTWIATRHGLTPPGDVSTGKSACGKVFRTELDWLVGMSHGRFSGVILLAFRRLENGGDP